MVTIMKKNKHFQKSFRAIKFRSFFVLLLSMCLFAVFTGCRAREVEDAVENIQIEFSNPPLEKAIRELAGIAEGPIMKKDVLDIEHFNAPRLNIQINSLEGVQHMKNLRTLEVPNSNISDNCLAYISDLENLRWLDLWNTRITDSGLRHIENITSLTRLYIGNNDITDAGLVYLEKLSNLLVLNLNLTRVTEAGIENLKKSLPSISRIEN